MADAQVAIYKAGRGLNRVVKFRPMSEEADTPDHEKWVNLPLSATRLKKDVLRWGRCAPPQYREVKANVGLLANFTQVEEASL